MIVYTDEELYASDDGVLLLNTLSDNVRFYMSELVSLSEPLMLEAVFWINRKKYEAMGVSAWLYEESAFMRLVFDVLSVVWACISGGISWLYSYVMYSRREPPGEWIHFATLSETSPRVARYLEIYEELPTETNVDIAHRISETMAVRRDLSEILTVVRRPQTDVVRTVFRGFEDPIPEIPLSADGTPSELEFICVSYLHPRMNEQSIQLTIPKSMMVVGNHLLSPAFVLRMLEYMPLYTRFHFDGLYSLHIMDNTFSQYVLTSNQYLVVEKESVRVVSR